MKLSERRKQAHEQVEKLRQLKVERCQAAVNTILASDQFKLSAIALPDAAMAVDNIINNVVSTVTDPTQDYIDVLKAKGFRQAEIRNLTHRLYCTYCVEFGAVVSDNITFEQMVGPVAEYMMMHQEVYSSLDPESMRAGT